MTSSYKQGLIERRGLSTTELDEIQELARLCNQFEGLDLKLNMTTLRERSPEYLNDFLYYAEDQLVGFLPLFIFNSLEGEVSGMVHPDYRRQGIFRQLFKAAYQECQRRSLPSLLLIAEQTSPGGQAFVRSLPTVYDHSEYKMVLQRAIIPTHLHPGLHFRRAEPADLAAMAQITAEAFKMPESDIVWYTPEALTRTKNSYYVGEVEGVVVGKIDVNHSPGSDYILGFAVRPEFQGQGYGRHILARTVQEILQRGQEHISLEVLTDNKQALGLYQSCGFVETGCYDYYRLSLSSEQPAQTL